MTIYLSEKAAQQAGLTPKRQKRGRNTRPDIPAAGRAETTGLSTLILRGWSTEYDPLKGHRMYVIGQPAYDTGYCQDEKAVCLAAKALNERI